MNPFQVMFYNMHIKIFLYVTVCLFLMYAHISRLVCVWFGLVESPVRQTVLLTTCPTEQVKTGICSQAQIINILVLCHTL